jgi:hypothetical protein
MPPRSETAVSEQKKVKRIWQSQKGLNERMALVCISDDESVVPMTGRRLPAKTRMLKPNVVGQYVVDKNDPDYDRMVEAMAEYQHKYNLDELQEMQNGAPVEGRLLPKYIKDIPVTEDAITIGRMKARLAELERQNADLIAKQNKVEGIV